MVNPLYNFNESKMYDGVSVVGTSTLPEIQTHVLLPSPPAHHALSSGAVDMGNWTTDHNPAPNIEEGDPVLCVSAPVMQSIYSSDVEWQWFAHGNYLDDPIGTVKFHVLRYVPKGWAIADGTSNSVENGGSGIDFTGYLLYGSNSSGPTPLGSINTGSSYSFIGIRIIERIDNSAS